ncbi:hypothetical protein CCP1ISM_6820001 [Azospirillaceae bacterium]
MRSRHSAAILTRMGVLETIAATVEEYVAIASRLGLDPVWRAEIRRNISTNKFRIYKDSSCISALETFLESQIVTTSTS